MIAANELMVGNYVRYKDSYKIKPERRGKYYAIIPDDILAISEGVDVIEPIALTPEILEKAGFEKINGYMVNKHKKDCHIVLINSAGTFKVSVTGPFGMVSTKSIFHLHQLQNLYFVLTGEELTIEL